MKQSKFAKFKGEFKKWMHLDVDDEDEEIEGELEEEIIVAPREEYTRKVPVSEKRSDRVVNIHTTTQLQVILVSPEYYEASSEIADHLKDRRTVVLNLESATKENARRILDLLSGVAYAMNGQIKRIAKNTYIITPYNVDLQGDLLDELENNGLYI